MFFVCVFCCEFDVIIDQCEQGVIFVYVDVFVSVYVCIVLMYDDVVGIDCLVVVYFYVEMF